LTFNLFPGSFYDFEEAKMSYCMDGVGGKKNTMVMNTGI
jgi:hypothetical protein